MVVHSLSITGISHISISKIIPSPVHTIHPRSTKPWFFCRDFPHSIGIIFWWCLVWTGDGISHLDWGDRLVELCHFQWGMVMTVMRSFFGGDHDVMMMMMTGWWFGTFFIFSYIGNNNPNWLIFFRGVQTTNQMMMMMMKNVTATIIIDYTTQNMITWRSAFTIVWTYPEKVYCWHHLYHLASMVGTGERPVSFPRSRGLRFHPTALNPNLINVPIGDANPILSKVNVGVGDHSDTILRPFWDD